MAPGSRSGWRPSADVCVRSTPRVEETMQVCSRLAGEPTCSTRSSRGPRLTTLKAAPFPSEPEPSVASTACPSCAGTPRIRSTGGATALYTRVQNGRSAGQAVQHGLRRGLERPVFAELHSYDVTRRSNADSMANSTCPTAASRFPVLSKKPTMPHMGCVCPVCRMSRDLASNGAGACALCMSIGFGLSIPRPSAATGGAGPQRYC